jgi:hypothetical protein
MYLVFSRFIFDDEILETWFDFRRVPWTLSSHCCLQKVSEAHNTSCLLCRGSYLRIWKQRINWNWIRMRNQQQPLQDPSVREGFHGKFILFTNSGRTHFLRSWTLPNRISFVREHFHIAFHLFANISASHFVCSWIRPPQFLFLNSVRYIVFFSTSATANLFLFWLKWQRRFFNLFLNLATTCFLFVNPDTVNLFIYLFIS